MSYIIYARSQFQSLKLKWTNNCVIKCLVKYVALYIVQDHDGLPADIDPPTQYQSVNCCVIVLLICFTMVFQNTGYDETIDSLGHRVITGNRVNKSKHIILDVLVTVYKYHLVNLFLDISQYLSSQAFKNDCQFLGRRHQN